MKDLRPGPGSSYRERLDESKRFGFFLFCAIASFAFTFETATILIFRGSINFDAKIAAVGSVAGALLVLPAFYFGVMQKRMIVIAILRVWIVTFLILQSLVFIAGIATWLHYGVRNPAVVAADSFLAAGLSLIGLFFGIFGLIRGMQHRWFAHVFVKGYFK